MAQQPEIPDFVSVLGDRVWYLTQSGRDMWCRPPHGFFFTTSDAATAFATAIGTELDLAPIAIASKELVSTEGIAAIPSAETSSFDAIAIGASSSSVPIAAANAVAASLEVKKNPCGGRHHMSFPLWVRYQIRSVRIETKSGSSASDTAAC